MLQQKKILNLLLIICSLCGFLEWGKNDHMYLFQAEAEIMGKLFTNPGSVTHPFILLPLAGQLILLFTLFQKIPNKFLTIIGVGFLGLLLGFMFIIGIIGMKYKIVISTLPFLLTAAYRITILSSK